MAEIVITIKDKPDGNVSITATPTFETMAMKVDSGEMPTAAETYALFALRKIREASRQVSRTRPKLNEFES